MRILALIGALAIAVALGAAIFFFGGFYSVAATAAEPGIINWALVNVRIASINRRATDSPPVSLDNLTSVEAGARRICRARVLELSRRTRREMGQVYGRHAAVSA